MILYTLDNRSGTMGILPPVAHCGVLPYRPQESLTAPHESIHFLDIAKADEFTVGFSTS